MALTTPILSQMNAFDATQEQVFSFSVVGGDQSVANTLTIKDNETLATVYTNRQVTFAFENTVPAGTLTNGKYYQAYVVTENSAGDKSAQSNTIQFHCYAQPTFAFSNIATTGIVSNASYSFEVTYNQGQNETLDSYVFNLYNAQGIVLSTSGNKYNSDNILPLTISYLFTGLENNTEYYVEANGVTGGGTQITTGRTRIYVQYEQPAFFSNLNLTNNCRGGYITVQANVVGVEGKSDPTPPTYINEQEVDLSGDGEKWVKWDDGFEIPENFTMRMWFRSAWNNSVKYPITKASPYLSNVLQEDVELFKITNREGEIIRGGVSYYRYHRETNTLYAFGYVEVLKSEDSIHGYTINSALSPITISLEELISQTLVLTVKRFNNLFEISLDVKPDEEGS